MVIAGKLPSDVGGKVVEVRPATDKMAEVVIVQTSKGDAVTLVTGSINGIADPKHRRVGQRGIVRWSRAAGYALQFFVVRK